MKATDYIAKYLEQRQVTHVFELIGGMITFLLDSLHQQTEIKIISMHHEQGAGFAAEGYGRMKGTVPGIAMATSGPGATNLLTAIGSCYFDSTPTIFITGQVNRHEQKGHLPIRQLGFQETDIVSMAKPITKASWLVNDHNDIPAILEEAFALATSGRPGPVLIDIPMDVQRAAIVDLSRLEAKPAAADEPVVSSAEDAAFITQLKAALVKAERPLILVGGGIISAQAIPAFRALVDKLNIPVVHSLMAVDALPASHPLRIGLIGSYGNRWANTALSESDLMLVLGSRLDVRQTGADPIDFKSERAVYHVDCEAGELNNRVKGCITLRQELNPFLLQLAEETTAVQPRAAWLNRIMDLKQQWPDTQELVGVEGINPNTFFHQLSRHSGKAAAFSIDVGQHQMWAAQSLDLKTGQRFLTSGGMGAMGFALPAGIGAAFASGDPVVVIAGDGGFQLNIQELQTVARNKLPIKMVVINNHCHGMVRQFQESYFEGRLQSTVWGYSTPSFTAVAEAYGIAATAISEPSTIEGALEKLWADPEAPYLLEVIVDTSANAYPKLAFGKPISEMEPFSKPLDMEAT